MSLVVACFKPRAPHLEIVKSRSDLRYVQKRSIKPAELVLALFSVIFIAQGALQILNWSIP